MSCPKSVLFVPQRKLSGVLFLSRQRWIRQGFLTKGFDEKAMLVTNHSFPFMVDFIKENHYENFVDLVQYEVPITSQILNRYKNFNEEFLKI